MPSGVSWKRPHCAPLLFWCWESEDSHREEEEESENKEEEEESQRRGGENSNVRPAQRAKLERCKDGIGDVNFKPKKNPNNNHRAEEDTWEQSGASRGSWK